MPRDFEWGEVRVTKVAAKGGGKGGDGQTQKPNIASNTLHSRDVVRITEVLSEGPVRGGNPDLNNVWKSVFLDNTPVVDASGNYNFNLLEGNFRAGYPSQDPIPGYPLGETPYSVGILMHYAVPVVRSITAGIDAVRLIMRIPAMYFTMDHGDITGFSVQFSAELQVNGGAWTEIGRWNIAGKTSSPYEYAVRLEMPAATTLSLRLIKDDFDHGDTSANDIYWSAYVEIRDGQISYDDTCVVGMTIDAQQFQSVPQRGFLLDGLCIQIPTNYDPQARTYTGDWDGTFKTDWTNNPAWVLYALLTNERWGLGRFLDVSAVDKWSFYAAAQYNDELVPDGVGGSEPRWRCNCVINTRQEAYTVVNAVASSMLGLTFWSNGTVFLVQDRASGSPTRLFSPADVVDGLFDYTGTDYRSRWTAAAVQWNDPSDQYNANTELVLDQAMVAEQGYRETQQAAFGCTSRGQAIRFGRWLIYTNQNETEVVSFKVGLENADLVPGEIIAINDPSRAGARLGGRLLTDTGSNTITLDLIDPAMTSAPTTWTIYVTVGSAATPDQGPPTVIACPVLAKLAGNQLQISGKTAAMVAGCNWVGSSSAVTPTHWRVAAVIDNGNAQYQISATEHHEEKYDYVDLGVVIPPPSFSLIPTGPLQAPLNISDMEYIYLDGSGTPQFGVVISWEMSPDPRARQYTLKMTNQTNNDERSFTAIVGTSQDVPLMRAGQWHVVLTGYDNLGRATQPVTFDFDPVGLSALPLPPEAVFLAPQGQLLTVTWVPTGEVDVMFWWVKWTPSVDGTAGWADATTTIARVSRDTTQIQTPLRAGTYMVKAIDGLGQESATFASATLGGQVNNNQTVAVIAEQPLFTGGLGTNWENTSGVELVLPPPNAPETIPAGLFPGDRGVAVNQTPTRVDIYTFATALDLGVAGQVSMTAILQGYADILGTVMVGWVPLASAIPLSMGAGTSGVLASWVPLSSADPLETDESDQWDAHIECRVSQDGSTWANWFPLKSTLITARAMQWRLIGAIYDLNTTLRIERCEVDVQVPLRTIQAANVPLDGTGHLIVAYSHNFLAVPAVHITVRSMGSGGTSIVVTESDVSHFKVEQQNAGGSVVSGGGAIDYIVTGYGGYA